MRETDKESYHLSIEIKKEILRYNLYPCAFIAKNRQKNYDGQITILNSTRNYYWLHWLKK